MMSYKGMQCLSVWSCRLQYKKERDEEETGRQAGRQADTSYIPTDDDEQRC